MLAKLSSYLINGELNDEKFDFLREKTIVEICLEIKQAIYKIKLINVPV